VIVKPVISTENDAEMQKNFRVDLNSEELHLWCMERMILPGHIVSFLIDKLRMMEQMNIPFCAPD
jgi:hypothetical protein